MKKLVFAVAVFLGMNGGGDDQPGLLSPGAMNSRVLRYVSAAVRRPYAKMKTREMLERLEKYRPMIEAKLDEAHFPRELIAGETKVRRLARGQRDAFKLKFTNQENADYVPKVMAALIIIQHRGLVAVE